jgi:hypothetical protein
LHNRQVPPFVDPPHNSNKIQPLIKNWLRSAKVRWASALNRS